MSDDTRTFLERWSKRKAAVRRGTPLPEGDREPQKAAEIDERQEPEEKDPRPEDAETAERAELERKLELPDPDTLDVGADFKVFMQKGVPEELRKKALRRLWRVNPIINHVDGLDDYCADFTDAAVAMPNIKTLYQVGRGMVAKVEEVAAKLDTLEEAEPQLSLGEDLKQPPISRDDESRGSEALARESQAPEEGERALDQDREEHRKTL